MYLSFVPRILLFSCSGLWCNLHFFQFSPLGWYWIVGFKWMTHWWLGFEWENVLNSTYFCFASKSKMHFHLMHIGKKPCHEWFFLNYYMNAASLKRQLMLSICWVVCLFVLKLFIFRWSFEDSINSNSSIGLSMLETTTLSKHLYFLSVC